MSIKRTSRLLKLLLMLQSESNSSPDKLSERLSVSRRTLYRDLQSLIEAGIPCYYDHYQECYRVNQAFFMPTPHLTEREAFSLLLLVHKASQLLNVPFGPYLHNAVIKIESQLPPQLKELCRQKLKDISVLPARTKTTDSLDEKFTQIQEAIQNRRILNISYYCKSENKVVNCNFSPLHIAFTNTWYVIGKVNLDRGTRTIKLDAIEKIEPSGKCFFESEEFDPDEYFGRAWSTLPEGKLYNVVLKFAPEIANEITSVQWHSTQDSTIQEDGFAVLEFRVDGLDEISSWILGFGDKVQVIGPKILRDKIRDIATSMARQHDECQNEKTTNHSLFLQGTS